MQGQIMDLNPNKFCNDKNNVARISKVVDARMNDTDALVRTFQIDTRLSNEIIWLRVSAFGLLDFFIILVFFFEAFLSFMGLLKQVSTLLLEELQFHFVPRICTFQILSLLSTRYNLWVYSSIHQRWYPWYNHKNGGGSVVEYRTTQSIFDQKGSDTNEMNNAHSLNISHSIICLIIYPLWISIIYPSYLKY